MLGSAIALLLLLIWGVAIEPRLVDYNEETVVVHNLPPALENKQIALIADFQIGMWFGNEDTVKKIVNRIAERRPAAVFIAGDFVYKPTDEDEREDVEREDAVDFMKEVNESIAFVRPLTDAEIPVCAVLGNHDYGMNYPDSVKNERLAAAVREKLEAAGVIVLDNAAVRFASGSQSGEQNNPAVNGDSANLYIVGIGSHYANNDKPEAALLQVPDRAPRVIFMHNPDSFAAIPANAAPLALAGHTHGGQIRVPGLPEWSWMALMTDEKIQADGWIDGFGQPGNRLYVNRGIGFSSFPVRINCRPELTFFTLRRKNG
jgi:hypothetical protein